MSIFIYTVYKDWHLIQNDSWPLYPLIHIIIFTHISHPHKHCCLFLIRKLFVLNSGWNAGCVKSHSLLNGAFSVYSSTLLWFLSIRTLPSVQFQAMELVCISSLTPLLSYLPHLASFLFHSCLSWNILHIWPASLQHLLLRVLLNCIFSTFIKHALLVTEVQILAYSYSISFSLSTVFFHCHKRLLHHTNLIKYTTPLVPSASKY